MFLEAAQVLAATTLILTRLPYYIQSNYFSSTGLKNYSRNTNLFPLNLSSGWPGISLDSQLMNTVVIHFQRCNQKVFRASQLRRGIIWSLISAHPTLESPLAKLPRQPCINRTTAAGSALTLNSLHSF